MVVSFGRSVIIAELWQPEVARPGNLLRNFCIFLEKRHLTVKFKNFVPRVFIATPIDVVVFKFREMLPKSCVVYWTKKTFGCLSNCSYCADHAQTLPELAPNNVLTVPQISSKSIHFWRSYSRTREHRFFAQ